MVCIAAFMASCTPDSDKGGAQQPQDKDIRILAIGNSFSVDAMEYLYGILEDAGYEEIVLGNIYKGGCSLEQHYTRFENDNGSDYTYYKNTDGQWTETSGCYPRSVLQEEEWDFITMQQVSGKSGMPQTYEPYLSDLLEIVSLYSPESELVWHMTWAYQSTSTHGDFMNYGSNQMTMYNAIVSTVQDVILPKFAKVIPNGTAVQNLRTSHIGDNLTRDGYHMSHDKGRYLAALTFAKALTGCDLSSVTYTPSGYVYADKDIAAMKEAADNACMTPFAVTASSFLPEENPGSKPPVEKPGDDDQEDIPTDPFEQVLSVNGKNPTDYEKLVMEWADYAYWNSTESGGKHNLLVTLYKADGSINNTAKKFVGSTVMYDKDMIPNGSLLIILDGVQYRPDGWLASKELNGNSGSGKSRPGNVSTQLVVVDDAWWGDWTYRAFNLSLTSGAQLTDAACAELKEKFAVFTPKI